MVDGAQIPSYEATPEPLRDLNLSDINGLPLRNGIDLNAGAEWSLLLSVGEIAFEEPR